MQEQDPLGIAQEAFSRIGARSPGLAMKQDMSAPVELSIEIPVQPGLKYAVHLNLQNRDELHFSVENFWLEWFPCTDPSRVEAYIETVSGFLSGHYRILEHHRGRRCTRADLQKPAPGGGWTTIGTTVHWGLSFSWRSTPEGDQKFLTSPCASSHLPAQPWGAESERDAMGSGGLDARHPSEPTDPGQASGAPA